MVRRPLPLASSQSAIASNAAAEVRPSNSPDAMTIPGSTNAPAEMSTASPSDGRITCTMGRPNRVANSWSRWSWAGTAMIAPVP